MREQTNGSSTPDQPVAWPNPVNQERLDIIQERARDIDRQARVFIREHPATVVLAAVAIGFFIGRLVRS